MSSSRSRDVEHLMDFNCQFDFDKFTLVNDWPWRQLSSCPSSFKIGMEMMGRLAVGRE